MNFNQDNTSLSISTENGYKLFNLSRLPSNIDLLYKEETTTKVKCIQRLFTSSLLAYSCEDEPNKIYLTHFRKNSIICDYTYPSHVRAILLNRSRLVVVLDEEIYIHSIKDMGLVYIIKDFSAITNDHINCVSLAAPLSTSALSNLIAYPIITSSKSEILSSNQNQETTNENQLQANGTTSANITKSCNGQVAIFDAHLLRTIKIIDAHENKISATCFANNSSYRAGSQENPLLLATASERGTVIRIWTIPQGFCIRELRRGLYLADIKQLSFSLNTKYIALISNTSTVHIWDTSTSKEQNKDEMDVKATEPTTTNTTEKATDHCEIDDTELERIQKEDENIQTNLIDNSWYNYLTSIASSVYNVTTSYVDATYNLATGGVINRAQYNCRIPPSMTATSICISKNKILLTTKENWLIVYDFNESIQREGEVSNFSSGESNSGANSNMSGIECKEIIALDLSLDDQTPIIVHEINKNVSSNANSKTNTQRTGLNNTYSAMALKNRKVGNKTNTHHLTRNKSKQIDIDLKLGDSNEPDIDDRSAFPKL